MKSNSWEAEFRIPISGNFAAFDEDKWTYIKINDVIFRNARLCVRCVMTTINPETGQLDQLEEPLKTLKSFRSVETPIVSAMSLNRQVKASLGAADRSGSYVALFSCKMALTSRNATKLSTK